MITKTSFQTILVLAICLAVTSAQLSTEVPNNIDCILEPKDGIGGLYLGNLGGARDLGLLRGLKIDSVLTVAAGTGLKYGTHHNVKHLIIHADDHSEYDLAQYFDEGIEFIRENLKTGNVFVHCFVGMSRSVTMVLAYMVQELKMELRAAFNHVKEKRWIAGPNEGFMRQLAAFEKKLKLKSSTEF